MTNTNISIIVAIASNNAIGKDNDLLWHISDDLKRFKSLTSGHAVIMGRNTWNSLPRRPLPKRRNIVLTHDTSFVHEGVEVAHSLQGAIDMVSDEEEVFVMGGAAIYRLFLPFATKLYVTWVWKDFDADVFFPTIDLSRFTKVSDSGILSDPESALSYSFVDYILRPSPHYASFLPIK
ncbi:MAG: dihydrofolate reductase [Bacteroidales bacterium]|nr:dihydrofolate reductase [Bacteroidales bacterium]